MSEPLVIFGLDAADPDLILNWAREGSLPTIASILERGTWARLAGREMISVHGVWTSFFSGVSIRDHGRYLARPLYPGTYDLREIHPRDFSARPFWADSRRALMTVDVPDSRPFRDLSGVQLTNWGDHPTSAPPEALPEGLLSEIRAAVGERIATDERPGTRRRDHRTLAQILRRVERKGALCRHLLAKGPFDLVVVVFGDCHAAGHRFRKYQQATADARAGGELRDAVRRTYAAVDRELARLLEGLPEPPNVFVASNSGIVDGYPVGDLMQSFCRKLGYHAAIDPSSAFGKTQALARSLAAVWRSPASGLLPEGTDWARTVAFAIPAYYTGYVRVNLEGREPLGIVKPGAEYNALVERLKADFLELADAETGEAVIERVTSVAELFGGGPPLRLPDLLVDWRHSALQSGRVAHPRALLVERRRRRPRGNHHSGSGLLLAAGPSIQSRCLAGEFSPMDFAPLFRALLGEPPGKRSPGDAIEAFMRIPSN